VGRRVYQVRKVDCRLTPIVVVCPKIFYMHIFYQLKLEFQMYEYLCFCFCSWALLF